MEAPLQVNDWPKFKSAHAFYKICLVNEKLGFLVRFAYMIFPNPELQQTCTEQTIFTHWLGIAHKIAVKEYRTEEIFKQVIGKAEKMFTGIKDSLKATDLPSYNTEYSNTYSSHWIFNPKVDRSFSKVGGNFYEK